MWCDNVEIPARLQRDDFRFIEIPRGEKGPKIKGWQSEACKHFNNFKLNYHINHGGNYGVVLGHGNLIVVDIDDVGAMGLTAKMLPKTFTVRTGRNGLHMYYICYGLDSCIRLQDSSGHIGGIGDIKARGGQVVGPGSEHPNGCKYEVLHDLPITTITKEKLESILGKYYVRRKTVAMERVGYCENRDNDFSISRLLDGISLQARGDQYLGSHPVHGSTNGTNFSVNTTKNVWYCFRHNTGGGPWHLLAVLEGLLDCDQCGPGSIDRNLFIDLLCIAEDRGYIPMRE